MSHLGDARFAEGWGRNLFSKQQLTFTLKILSSQRNTPVYENKWYIFQRDPNENILDVVLVQIVI